MAWRTPFGMWSDMATPGADSEGISPAYWHTPAGHWSSACGAREKWLNAVAELGEAQAINHFDDMLVRIMRLCEQGDERLKDRLDAALQAFRMPDGRRELGRLQLLRVFIDEGAKGTHGDPDGVVGAFCASVLGQVDSAGEPSK